MFERECLLLFILIYHIKRTSSICGQASGEEITYLYDYSANDSPTSIYTPTVISAEPSLTCKSTVKAGVLKNETFLCNRLCVTTMTPLIKKTNTTTSYNYTNDFLVPAGFEINRHIQPVICAKTSELCGATKPLYWNKNTGELSLTNDYDPFDKPICFIWGEDSSQYQRMLKTQQNQCPTPGSTKKSRRNKRNLPFDFWGGGRNQSNEADKSTDNDWMNNNTAPKTPCTSNSSRFDWFPWSRISKQTESTTPSTIFTTRVTTNQPSTNQPISQPNPSTSRLVTSTTVAVRKSEQTTKVTFPTLDPDNITRRRPRDLSNELNDTSSSSSTSKTTSSSPTTSTPSSTTTSTTTTTAVSSSSGGRSASSSSSTSTITTTTTFRFSSHSGISIPSSSTASSSSSSTTTAQSSSGIASSSTSRSSTVTQSRSSQSSQSSSSIASTSRATETSRSSIPASSTTIHSSSWSSTRLSSSSTHIASSSRSTNLANNVTVPTPPINQTIGPAGTSPSIPSSVTFTNKASSFRSQNQTIGPGGTSQAGISGNVSFATTTPKGIILASSTPASSSTTVSSIVQTTTSNINSKKSAICSALSNLENSNTISLSAVTSILSQYNVTLDDALNALNLSLAQISKMSVSEIIDNATASCQGYVSSVITLRTRQTTNRVSGTTYNGVTYDNGDGNSNNNSVGPNYGGGRTRSYQNYNGSSGYDDGGDTLIVVPIPDRSYSQQDREDRDNDNGDYWYDGTTYQYNHRIWRWVLLGVFCALIVAIAFALLCFACYRPYRPSTTTTIVTPLPVTEKIYTSSGHVDVPPLPISPMPAYSNAATLRL